MSTGSARFRFGFADMETARGAQAALSPENGPHCTMRRDGPVLLVEVPEARLGSFAATVDDLLACLGAVQRAQDATS